MKFCQPHWDKLKAAIAERGLSHLIAKSGQEAMAREIRALENKQEGPRDYDPLMSAHWQIAENALRCGGL